MAQNGHSRNWIFACYWDAVGEQPVKSVGLGNILFWWLSNFHIVLLLIIIHNIYFEHSKNKITVDSC